MLLGALRRNPTKTSAIAVRGGCPAFSGGSSNVSGSPPASQSSTFEACRTSRDVGLLVAALLVAVSLCFLRDLLAVCFAERGYLQPQLRPTLCCGSVGAYGRAGVALV